MSMMYERPTDLETSWRVLRVRMWEKGHTFDEIDRLSLADIGDIVGYWSEKDEAETRLARQKKARAGH